MRFEVALAEIRALVVAATAGATDVLTIEDLVEDTFDVSAAEVVIVDILETEVVLAVVVVVDVTATMLDVVDAVVDEVLSLMLPSIESDTPSQTAGPGIR